MLVTKSKLKWKQLNFGSSYSPISQCASQISKVCYKIQKQIHPLYFWTKPKFHATQNTCKTKYPTTHMPIQTSFLPSIPIPPSHQTLHAHQNYSHCKLIISQSISITYNILYRYNCDKKLLKCFPHSTAKSFQLRFWMETTWTYYAGCMTRSLFD